MTVATAFRRDARLSFLRGDITVLAVDAVVNAANAELAGGGGVDGAIHRAAGPRLAAACAAIREARLPGPACPTGSAVATPGFGLPARWIIHAVGPVWSRSREAESRSLLAATYASCLSLARELGAASLAFPNVSTGVYGFPKAEAASIAVETCLAWLAKADAAGGAPFPLRICFACFDGENEEFYREAAALDPGQAEGTQAR
jgi:O-acetyl-ADP-ribose deacetylase (regulator of RNase III)